MNIFKAIYNPDIDDRHKRSFYISEDGRTDRIFKINVSSYSHTSNKITGSKGAFNFTDYRKFPKVYKTYKDVASRVFTLNIFCIEEDYVKVYEVRRVCLASNGQIAKPIAFIGDEEVLIDSYNIVE